MGACSLTDGGYDIAQSFDEKWERNETRRDMLYSDTNIDNDHSI